MAVPHRNPFKFSEKPNILDRDRILVPAGWDSWGKIGVLREGFDAKAWGEAWDRDIEASNDGNQRWRQCPLGQDSRAEANTSLT